MKRIFLTSGLVLCMACPAFATASWSGQTNNNPALSDGCNQPNLGVFSGPTTMKAIWDANSYTLTYQPGTPETTVAAGNSVSGMPGTLAQTVTYDGSHTVASDPSLTGYTFNGWLASDALGTSVPAATGNLYPGGASIAAYKGVGAQTMTAQWTANQYDVTYANSDGAATDTKSDAATYDADYTALDIGNTNIQTPTGYVFVGWSETVNPTADRGTADGLNPVNTGSVHGGGWTGETPWRIANDNKTVYATFLAKQFNITYSCTGGEPDNNTGNAGTANAGNATGTAPDKTLVTYNETYTLAANTCTLQGYDFAGWDCPGLTGKTAQQNSYYAAGASTGNYTTDSNVTCTAKWTPKSIGTITWNDNGATTAHQGGDTSCTYDSTIVLPTAPERIGYSFGGWEVASN